MAIAITAELMLERQSSVDQFNADGIDMFCVNVTVESSQDI